MNIYFSGIGGVGLGALAEFASDMGHKVQGSDPEDSPTIERLSARGIAINKKQKGVFLQTCHRIQPIDWLVYSSALPEDHPELAMARMLGIKTSKRDALLAELIASTDLKMVAFAGTHGKTSSTALMVWALQQAGVPVSFIIGGPVGFGPSGKYDPSSTYFVYECDEYDRNMLRFHPYLSIITSLDYDHPDTYSTPEEYIAAFQQFLNQSETAIMWETDGSLLDVHKDGWVLKPNELIDFKLPGEHNRRNATLVAKALERIDVSGDHVESIERFPGVSRRFERLQPGIYSDYAHHPTEIASTLQLAREISDHVVLVYQPHQNVRQHQIRTLYIDCFELAETVYWLPTHLTREDPTLPVLTPDELTENITNIDSIYTADLDDELWETLQRARDDGKLVIFMGAGSIDTWAREQIALRHETLTLISNQEGSFVLEQHAEQPGVVESGKLAGFAGAYSTTNTSLRTAAAQSLRSATNLTLVDSDLVFFKLYSKTAEVGGEKYYVGCYMLTGINSSELVVRNGKNFELVGPNELSDYPLSILTRTIIAEYTHPAL